MAIVCDKSESKFYRYQCGKKYTGKDRPMIHGYCKECLRAQAADSSEEKE